MNWKTIGLKTSLQISFEMCERVELNNDPCGDGSDEFVYYGESLAGNGWGDASYFITGEVGSSHSGDGISSS